MKKFAKVLAAALICALAVVAAVACSSPEVSRSTESFSSAASESSSSSEAAKASDSTYILLVGNDSRYGTVEENGVTATDPSFGDTIMLMRLDPENNRIGIMSIPRDTATDMDGRPEKINAVHYYFGGQGLADEVGKMLGINIPYYVDIDFVHFVSLIDKIGGVTVDVPMTVTLPDILSGDSVTVEAGHDDLDGVSALVVSRVRKAYASNGEAIRQMISRDLVASAIQTIASDPTSDAAEYAEILESLGESNMSQEKLESYIQSFIDNGGSIKFNLGTGPYSGGVDDSGSWRVPRDEAVYAELLKALDEGGSLTDIVALPAV